MKSCDGSASELILSEKDESNEHTTLTVWVKKSVKIKYADLQERSGRKLSKKISKHVEDLIEKAKIKV